MSLKTKFFKNNLDIEFLEVIAVSLHDFNELSPVAAFKQVIHVIKFIKLLFFLFLFMRFTLFLFRI